MAILMSNKFRFTFTQKTLFSLKTFKIDSIFAISLMNWYGFSQKSCTFVA